MRSMVLLIDTNVLLNYITNRKDDCLQESIEVIRLCAMEKCTGVIAFHTLSTLWYVLRNLPAKTRRQNLLDICEIFTVVSAGQDEVIAAINNDEFEDFEDCLQDKCAKEAGADYIITCNVKDFVHGDVEAITPSKYLQLLREMDFQ